MKHVFGIMFSPLAEWEKIREDSASIIGHYLKYIVLIALLPPVAWYYGSTVVGWTLGERVIRLTPESAMQIMTLFYLAILFGIGFLGFMVHWMSETYGAQSSFIKGILIASLCATPLFIAGAVGFYPILWLDMLIGVFAVCWSTYLLYNGIPIVMKIPETRGFLFASAVIGVSLVMLVCLLVATTLLWDWGAMPAFTD